jgi:hypothetical protein
VSIDDSILNYDILEDYSHVVEPYSPMQLVVSSLTDNSVYYEFEICDDSKKCVSGKLNYDEKASESAVMACSPHQSLTISVSKISSTSGEKQASVSEKALCLYVRREIRSYSSDDIDKIMDALYVVYSVDEQSGQKLYGQSFHNYQYALDFHHFNAAFQDADHIHEGNGFLVQHIKMTNIIEESMQAVDPSVVLPYW